MHRLLHSSAEVEAGEAAAGGGASVCVCVYVCVCVCVCVRKQCGWRVSSEVSELKHFLVTSHRPTERSVASERTDHVSLEIRLDPAVSVPVIEGKFAPAETGEYFHLFS